MPMVTHQAQSPSGLLSTAKKYANNMLCC